MSDDNDASASARCVTPVFGSVIPGLLEKALEMDSVDDCDNQERVAKRHREDSTEEEGWTEIKGKKKSRHCSNSSLINEKIEVYISSKERMPKQFALARILKENNVSNVLHVKYLSPFKIRLQFESEADVQKLFTCERLLEKGWRLQKASELSVCYGMIKDVDLDLTDEEILQNISCLAPAKLLSVKRLARRNRDEGGWCPSETLRLCFEGNVLPSSVRVCDVNIKVLPYIHQVSQCSQCWKLGHTKKMCPSKKVVCPKCAGDHENCDTQIFVNIWVIMCQL